jgi:hypothetical protein
MAKVSSCTVCGSDRGCDCERLRRPGRRFTKAWTLKAHKLSERLRDAEGEWLAPRVAARYVRCKQGTLFNWQTSCPFLAGAAVRTAQKETAYKRIITYYLKSDLDRVLAAKAARTPIPEVSGHVYLFDAARELGVSVRTLRRMQRSYGPEANGIKRPGKARDGRPLPRSYVPRAFVDACKAGRKRELVPEDKISAREAAARLSVPVGRLHNLIHAKLLRAETSKATTVANCKERGTLRYPRKAALFDRATIDRLHAIMVALPATPVERFGRTLTPLRVAAEMLRDSSGPDSAGSRPMHAADSAPFFPTQFQERILRALDKKALTADLLQTRLNVDRKQLYRDGLRQLKAVGRVRNNRRVGGYYRPDAPPERASQKLN